MLITTVIYCASYSSETDTSQARRFHDTRRKEGILAVLELAKTQAAFARKANSAWKQARAGFVDGSQACDGSGEDVMGFRWDGLGSDDEGKACVKSRTKKRLLPE